MPTGVPLVVICPKFRASRVYRSRNIDDGYRAMFERERVKHVLTVSERPHDFAREVKCSCGHKWWSRHPSFRRLRESK